MPKMPDFAWHHGMTRAEHHFGLGVPQSPQVHLSDLDERWKWCDESMLQTFNDLKSVCFFLLKLHFPSLLHVPYVICFQYTVIAFVLCCSPVSKGKAPNLEQLSDVNIWLQLCSEAPDTATSQTQHVVANSSSISDISDIDL